MNYSFSLQQTSTTGNLDSNLISRLHKLKLMALFLLIKNENPKLRQSQIASQLSYSTSTLQRYRNDINLLSLYRIQSNNSNKLTKKVSNTSCNSNSHRELDLKRPRLTSNDLKPTSNESVENKKKQIERWCKC